MQQKNNKKMIYIGHSMGTTLSYTYSIAHKEEAENNVCGFISLAPVTYFDYSVFGEVKNAARTANLHAILAVNNFYRLCSKLFLLLISFEGI